MRTFGHIDTSPLGHDRGLHRWVMAEVSSVLSGCPNTWAWA
jgi:hypothetical protein